ncbi:MAG: serine hydrolase, partial [Kangiellaceae bacterium]|nr:serine hydrolase [Kangiellaceae bacterium]
VLLLFYTSSLNASGQIDASIKAQLDKQLKLNSERYGVVGQSVRILKNNQPIYDGYYGLANIELQVPITDKHIYPSYSVTKLFTSVLMMQLVERGVVDLKVSIRTYLPYLPERWQNVTVEHTLNHTSGIPRYFDIAMAKNHFLPNKKEVFLSLVDEPDHFPIGTRNQYNNTNFLILSAIIETKTGKSYQELVRDNIILPLKLNNTGHASALKVVKNMVSSYSTQLTKNEDVDWPEYTFSHSALYSTPTDLTTFMTALVKGQFIKKETLKRLWQPMKLLNGNDGRYAFGFEYKFQDGFIHVGHDGGNRIKLRHYFQPGFNGDNYTIAYLTNGNSNGVWTDVLAESMMSIVDSQQFKQASLNEQFLAAAIEGKDKDLQRVFSNARNIFGNDLKALERFLLYRAYAVRYGVGAKASIAAFEFYVKQFPQSTSALSGLAEAWAAIGNNDKAIDNYRKVLEITPESGNAKRRIEALEKTP